jgi:hypothetical protein
MSTHLRRAAVALVAALALAGCSPGPAEQLDDAALTTALRAAGVEPTPDVASWRTAALAAFCNGDEDTFKLSLTLDDATPAYLAKTRAIVAALCPERVPLVDKALDAR